MENRKLNKDTNLKIWGTIQVDLFRVVRENEKSILVKLPSGFCWFSKKLCTKLEYLNKVSIRVVENETYKVYKNANGPWENPDQILGANLIKR